MGYYTPDIEDKSSSIMKIIRRLLDNLLHIATQGVNLRYVLDKALSIGHDVLSRLRTLRGVFGAIFPIAHEFDCEDHQE